ncbi:MAG: leucine--tRNA ligase [Geopsychrobacter sp.]|nr:leucine--tRNA ligase [Geopsychrobacter sp.]
MTKEHYNFDTIEKKWQDYWLTNKTFKTEDFGDKPKYYALDMFPYPSGAGLHVGHPEGYTATDIICRYKRMRGFNVLHPMGWDAFGMPAENAAIENGTHPGKWTYENIESMRVQLKRIGLSYDWSREFATCDSDYSHWEQLIFLRMLEKNLAYKKTSNVNWCNDCQTVLANEQVEDGCCWRCNNPVEQKELDQWFFRITEYADELLNETENLKGWPEKVLAMQRNWIGKSYGCEIDFSVKGSAAKIKVFTTRPDTLYGATFMSLAPEHPLVGTLVSAEQRAEVELFCAEVSRQNKLDRTSGELEKKGVFTGAYCLNPLTGQEIPVFLANFVLMDYGTGAVMAVPAHDQRDFEFAQKYQLDIQVVIQPEGASLDPQTMQTAMTGTGVLVNSGDFNGISNEDAKERIASYLDAEQLGCKSINYRLRDWGVSRQRYWGTPIPIIYCDSCGTVPVPEKDLPVKLPMDVEITGEGGSPLARHQEFLTVACPCCGAPARRESDTFDTFVESSWYFARYASPEYDQAPLDADAANYWLPVDQYIGGIEHAVMHLLYARFFTKVLRDLGMVKASEPFTNLLTQGMVCMESQRCSEHGWLYPEEVRDGKCVTCGRAAELGRTEKMSKSKKNVVDPNALIERYGADTARLFSLFAAPPEKDLEWNEQGVEGCYRFLNRVWRAVHDNLGLIESSPEVASLTGTTSDLRCKTHETIKKVSADVDGRFHFNTAIASVMELVNVIYGLKKGQEQPAVLREAIETVVRLLAPFVPHICEELWQRLGHEGGIERQGWPSWDEAAMVKSEIEMVVQVNGKLRSKVKVAIDIDNAELEKIALAEPNVARFIEGKQIRKVICVAGRLVNIVVAG